MSEEEDQEGISVYIAATSVEDARILFEKAMKLAATGKHFEGALIFDETREDSGCARLYTDLYNGRR